MMLDSFLSLLFTITNRKYPTNSKILNIYIYSPETPIVTKLYKKKAPKKGLDKVKRKHPSKEEKKKLGTRTKVQASIQPKRGGPQGGKGTTKY
jgi:hypothetical protein